MAANGSRKAKKKVQVDRGDPLLRSVPNDWEDRWRLLREFAQRWLGISARALGSVSNKVNQLEKKLEKKLWLPFPPSLREWLALAADLRIGSANDVHVYDATECGLSGPYEILGFYEDGNRDAQYFVAKKDFSVADPPVYWVDKLYGDGGLHASITSFAFCLLLREISAHRKLAGRLHVTVKPTNQLLHRLTEAFPIRAVVASSAPCKPKLEFRGEPAELPLPSQVKMQEIAVFERENIIAALATDPLLGGGGKDERVHFIVAIKKPMPREEIPDFLWEYCGGEGMGLLEE